MINMLKIILFMIFCSLQCTGHELGQVSFSGDWITAKDTLDPRSRLTGSRISFRQDGFWHSKYRGVGVADSSKGQYLLISDTIMMIREISGYQKGLGNLPQWVFRNTNDTIKCKIEISNGTLKIPCMFEPYDTLYKKK